MVWFLVMWALVVSASGPATAQGDRIVAIGDIHGADGQLRALLETVELTDSQQQWVGGHATLVQTGDFTDRGAGVKRVLDLLMRLEIEASEAGGRVVVLLGNHEAMNLMANLRDTTPELLASFATPQSDRRREDAYEADLAFRLDLAAELGPLAQDPPSRDAWMEAHPPGFFEYLDALGPDGLYGRWLRAKPVVVRLGDSILLHGGLHPDAPTDLSAINERARLEIETYDRYRQRLAERRIILPFYTYQETTTAVQQELEAWTIRLSPTGPPAPGANPTLTPKDREHLEMVLDLQRQLPTWSLINEDGPVWFRGFARWEEADGLPMAQALTTRYGVARIVVGHSIPTTRLITPRFGNRVFLIDTGMLTAYYTGRASALEIDGDNVDAVYLERRVTLVDVADP